MPLSLRTWKGCEKKIVNQIRQAVQDLENDGDRFEQYISQCQQELLFHFRKEVLGIKTRDLKNKTWLWVSVLFPFANST